MNPLVTIKNIQIASTTNSTGNTPLLSIDGISLSVGESMLICGDNASGKSLLGKLISDQTTMSLTASNVISIDRPNHIELVSFDVEDTILALDRYNDDSENMNGGIDWGRSAGELIGHHDLALQTIELLAIGDLVEKPFKILSTGQVRKVLLAKAIAAKPQLLILDEPYAGLDIASQQYLTKTLTQLMAQGQSIIIIDFYHHDLPQDIHKILLLALGEVAIFDYRTAVLSSSIWHKHTAISVTLPHHLPDCHHYKQLDLNQPLVALNNVRVAYDDNPVFDAFCWQFCANQHWRLAGPNGCGKSTLLSLINGDNPKAYGQDITLFGRKRGSGETIWDIKKHYGLVSAQFHRDYRASTNVLGVIISGFFDTIGLYDAPSNTQIDIAHQWLALLNLTALAKQPFSQLSYGEQRLVLIARAVVKLPLILILDEPCLGLDNQHRMQILALIDYITRHSNTHILFVSHDNRDQLTCLTHQLDFVESGAGYMINQRTLT
jgi:molybdate transport system ATP-binding protein